MQLMTKENRSSPHDQHRTPDTDATPPATRRRPAARRAAGRRAGSRVNLRQSGIYIAFALIVVLFAVLTDGALLQPQNISNIVVQNSYILILAIGMMLVIIAGHIDLSVGSVVAFTGAVVRGADGQPATCRGRSRCCSRSSSARLVGAWQGFWVAYFGIPAFIVTLAGMLLFRALTLTVLGNQGIGPFPDAVRTLANGFTAASSQRRARPARRRRPVHPARRRSPRWPASSVTQWRARRGPARLRQAVEPLPLFVAEDRRRAPSCSCSSSCSWPGSRTCRGCWCCSPSWSLGYSLLTNRAVFGRHIYAIGGNLQAATLSGVKVKSVTFWIFVNMGVLAALAGIIFAGRLNQAGPTAGNTFELDAIAAAFIGGAAVQGGVGKVVGAITGGLIMGVINNGMSLIGAPSERVMLVKGLVLLAAVAFDVWTKRRAGAASR